MTIPAHAQVTNQDFARANFTANEIWSAAYERLVAVARGFTTYRRVPSLTLQPTDLPCLAVYLLRDRETVIGDLNVGEPKFMHNMTLGISGIILQSNVDAQLEELARVVQLTRLALYTSPAFMRLISGIVSNDTQLLFSKPGGGELPIAEYRMELVVAFETVWPPDVPDDFLVAHFETRYPPGSDPAKVQQIVRTWDVLQNE